MIPSPFICCARYLMLIAGLALAAPTGHAQTVIYEQSFTPGAGTAALNGTAPTTGANNWDASGLFQADGDIVEGTTTTPAGSATLAFTPANGFIYTLDASFRNMGPTVNVGNPEQDWVAVGFAKGQSTGSTANDRFINTNVIGKAWMLLRGADTVGTLNNFTHLGSATSGTNGSGAPTSIAWNDPTLAATYGGGMDMRVVLDTTGGTGAWTATWFAKLPASGSFTEVRGPATLVNGDINSVGVAISGRGIDGDLTYFRLTSLDPNAQVPPTIVAKTPDGTSGVYPATDLVATFSADIVLKPGGTVTLRNLGDPSGTSDLVITLPDAQATLSGRNLIINPSANLPFNTSFAVRISPDAVEDTANPPQDFIGITDDVTWTFSTAAQDLTAPVITLKSPLDNATGVSRAANIVATFDDTILAGSGNITLKDLDDGTTTQVIPVSDAAQVAVSGNTLTIDPTVSLAAGRNYAVQISAGAVKNFSEVGFAGIPANDDTAWNFQTLATSPNVIFILGDDQGWYDYGFMRRPGVDKAAIDLKPSIPQVAKTPALDRLADEGLAFIHGYSAPVCRPALTSIITGTYLQQHWVTGNDLVNSSGTRIDDSSVEARMQVLNPLPRTLFNQLGYASFQTGKWWEGHHSNGGFTHGDTVNSLAAGTAPPQWSGSAPSYARARHGDWGLMTGRVDYVNDIQAPAHPIPYANTVQTVTDFINTQVAADQPFFLWYAPFLPHDPFDPPAGLVAEYTALGLNSTDAKYYANIERFDGGVGAILNHLDAKGIADNTIIILICDNGRALDLSTVGKLTPYDSGVRSPIIVRWPDRIRAGGVIEPAFVRTPVSMVDMVPTVHHALGLPTYPEMRGIDLLDPDAVAARGAVCGSDHDVEILTLSNPTASLESRFAIRDGWKLILFTNGTKQLFHLYDGSTPVDPHETTNLAASNPRLVSELTMEIVNWYAEPNDYNSWIGDPALGIAPANRGFALDLDGDGLTNGVEAWFGTDPRAFSAGLVNHGTAGTTTTFTHPRNPQAPSDLTGSYEWSPDLVDWYAGDGVDGPPGGPKVTIVPSPAGMATTVTVTASEALQRIFLRAGVVRN